MNKSMKYIHYRTGYKYQLAANYAVVVPVGPCEPIKTQFISLWPKGMLLIKPGYAWDGPSGPTVDTRSSMRASLVHDALYQLMRQGLLDQSWRKTADDFFYTLCIEDKMWKWRAKLWHRELRKFAKSAASPKNTKKAMVAP